MSDKPRSPKLEIEINTPVTVTIGKNFWKGSNEYGESFGYNVTADGSEYTFFASPFVHERFQAFGQGTTVKVVKRQKAGQKNATWEIGEVNGNGSAPRSAPQAQSEPKYKPAPFNRTAYRELRIDRMHQALQDAAQVEALFGREFAIEDLRAVAISFVIEEQRDRVPLESFEPPADLNIPETLEAIKKTLTDYIGGTSETDQAAKADLLEKAFETRKWQEITQMSGEKLTEGHAKLQAAIEEEIDDIPF